MLPELAQETKKVLPELAQETKKVLPEPAREMKNKLGLRWAKLSSNCNWNRVLLDQRFVALTLFRGGGGGYV